MKLSQLHRATAQSLLAEALDPEQEEKIAYLNMMFARQGLDGEKITHRIRGLIDPAFAKTQGQKATLQRWLDGAKAGETRKGTAYGRKVSVTVLESEIREMISEGMFKGVGAMVIRKLRDLISGERKEHELVAQALDNYRGLAAIVRYARNAEESVYDDPKFWELVDQMTRGKAAHIKKIVHATYERLATEMADRPTNGVLTEMVIHEARVSQVMASLGLDQDYVDGIMRQYSIEDEDYDISRLKGAYEQAKGAVSGAAGKAKEAVTAPFKALAQKAGDVTSGVRDAADKYRIKEENEDLADEVVKVAYALMQLDEAGAETPEEASKVLDQQLGDLGEGDYEEITAERPEIIPDEALR